MSILFSILEFVNVSTIDKITACLTIQVMATVEKKGKGKYILFTNGFHCIAYNGDLAFKTFCDLPDVNLIEALL